MALTLIISFRGWCIMAATKLKPGTFKHIESEIYLYEETMREIKRIRSEIIWARPPFNNIGRGKGNIYRRDPTGMAATTLLTHRRLEQLERIASAIRTVYEELPEEKKRLVQLRYWTKPQTRTWAGIAQMLHISERQARRWRDEIVLAIAERLGWR